MSAMAACGETISGYVVGNKTVAVQLSSGKDKKYAIDDDGYLVISLAVAHCRGKHPLATPKLTESQAKCVKDKVAPGKLNFFSYDTSEHKKTADMEFYKRECGINYHQVWSQAVDERKKQKLTCAEDIKDIVKKAVAQNEAYVAEKTSDDGLNQLTGSNDDKITYTSGQLVDRAYAKKLEKIVDDPKSTVADLDNWVGDLEGTVKRHGYQIAYNDELRPGAYSHLVEILRSVNADFPFSRPQPSADGKMEKCYKPFDSQLIANLKGIAWANDPKDARLVAPAVLQGDKAK